MANNEQWALISTGTTTQVLTNENRTAVWRAPVESKAVLQLGSWELKVNRGLDEVQYKLHIVTLVLIFVAFFVSRLSLRLRRTEALLRRFNITDQK